MAHIFPYPMTRLNKKQWHIWIDTGGTFTDCLALSPAGKLVRTKVLSSGALRGTVIKQLDNCSLKIAEKWGLPEHFVDGFQFVLLGRIHETLKVQSYDVTANTLKLHKAAEVKISPESAFELKSPNEAPILAAQMCTGTIPGTPLPELAMRFATTRGTNALLERKGASVALFITKGFADLLLIGTQQRPDIFALEIVKPEPLYREVIEVDERLAADGAVIKEIDLNSLQPDLKRITAAGVKSAAVALMHSYINSEHEEKLVRVLRQAGFEHISRSSDLAPFIKLLPRAETTVVDAYLSPMINEYLRNISSFIRDGTLHVMTSAGGLIRADQFRGKDSLLSGPAGGVVGAAVCGANSGFQKIITFDMGGTSTDVARFDHDYEYTFEHQVADAHLVSPALAIESVAAGGGSICEFDGFRLKVGPESAGAFPGPACYGAGGPLTLTDVNLLLGRLDSQRFEIPISESSARSRIAALQESIVKATGESPARQEILQGFLDIVNERMAGAIQKISISKGADSREYVLVSFGGAGGQHACGVAERLGMKQVLIPKDASLLSAFGLGHAVIERFAERQILKGLTEVESEIATFVQTLTEKAQLKVMQEDFSQKEIEVRRCILNLRFKGQDSSLGIEYGKGDDIRKKYHNQYNDIYGHWPEGREIEVESIRVVCSSVRQQSAPLSLRPKPFQAMPAGEVTAFFGKELKISCFERKNLQAWAQFRGPALIFERHSTVVVDAGWEGFVDAAAALVLTKVDS